MSASEQQGRWYHDVIGVAFIVHEAGSNSEEAFRYPWYKSSPSPQSPLGLFDQISPETLAQLAKSHRDLSGELLEMKFGDVRLICRPVELPHRNDKLRTASFYNLVFAVTSEMSRKEMFSVETRDLASRLYYFCFDKEITAKGSSYRLPRTLYPVAPFPQQHRPGMNSSTAAATPAAASLPLGTGEGSLDDPPPGFTGGAEGEEYGLGGSGFGERGPGVDLSLLRGALMMASRALHHEEVLNGFISESGRELLRKKEELAEIDSPNAKTAHRHSAHHSGQLQRNCERVEKFGGFRFFGGYVPAPSERRVVRERTWRQSVLDDCQLAQDIQALFTGLTGGVPFEVAINRWSALSVNVSVQRDIPDAKRYETIILREEEHIVSALLPRDSSPQIRQLVEMADPLQTLDEMAYKSEMELSQMLRLARHMVLWGEARLVDTLSKTNRYKASRAAGRAAMARSPVAAEFSGKFPRRSLAEELARFGRNRPLSEIIDRAKKSQRASLVAVLIFLLRRDLLVQMQRYVVLLVPAQRPQVPHYSHPAVATAASSAVPGAADRGHGNVSASAGAQATATIPEAAAPPAGRVDTRAVAELLRQEEELEEMGNDRAESKHGVFHLRKVLGVAAAGTSAEGAGAYDGRSWSAQPTQASTRWGELVPQRGTVTDSWGPEAGRFSGGPSTSYGNANNTPGSDFQGSTSDGGGGGGGTSSLFETPSLAPHEEQFLRARDDGSAASELMRRLAPFFRGKLHLREIVWRLDIDDMPAVEQVLKAYSDVLVETWRPARDPAPEHDDF